MQSVEVIVSLNREITRFLQSSVLLQIDKPMNEQKQYELLSRFRLIPPEFGNPR